LCNPPPPPHPPLHMTDRQAGKLNCKTFQHQLFHRLKVKKNNFQKIDNFQ
jgi:hypothetical protein